MQHRGQHRLDGVVAAAEVHREYPVPGGAVDVLKKLLLCDARVVHKQRDLAEFLFGLGDHGLHCFRVGHIRLYPDGVGALAAELFAQGLREVRALHAVYAHGPALSGQRLGAGPADAAGGAGDERDLSHSSTSSPRCPAIRLRQ